MALQVVPSHLYGAQSVVVPSGARSVWSPSHDALVLGTQLLMPALSAHANFVAQSASLAHVVPQDAPAQTYGVHSLD